MCIYIKPTKFMKIGLLSLVFLLVLVSLHNKVTAQSLQRQSVSCAGGYIYTEGTLVRQTIGQPYSTTTKYNDNITYRPGFQQPIFKINLIHTNINLDVFPNPATNWVTLKSSKSLSNVKIQVVDISGKLIVSQEVEEFKSHTLNCEEWPNGTYVISLSDGGQNGYSSKLIILK